MPKKYTQEEKTVFIDSICKEHSEGKQIIDICKKDKYPSRSTFYDWVLNDEYAYRTYTRAHELHCEVEFQEILKISDNNSNDFYLDSDKKLRVNHVAIQRHRLMVDTRKWRLSKMLASKYGEKLKIDVGDERKQVGGFDISLLQPDTLKLIERDLKNANIQDAEILEDDKNLLE